VGSAPRVKMAAASGGAAAKKAGVDALLKLLVIGDSAVGKTSLLLRYMDDKFSSSFVSTIGVDFKTRTEDIDGRAVRLQIWDTAGQERFRTITTSYFRGAHGILLCFDATERKTFTNVASWAAQIKENADETVAVVLVGTKVDMADKRAVTDKEAEALAATHGMRYLATSAKLNSNVKEAFDVLARAALKAQDAAGGRKAAPTGTVKPTAKAADKGGASGCAC
jgi:Ras-related protein Rab-8A